jgi:hypothetical protein
MNWITEGIALGGWYDCIDHPGLEAAGIRAVLQLRDLEAALEDFPSGWTTLSLRVADGRPLPQDMLRQGVEFIREQQAAGRRMLVACSAGRSRSATFLAAYLHEEGMELEDAILRIIRRRRSVLPHPELLRSLIGYYGLPSVPEKLLASLVRRRRQELEWTGSSPASPSEE